MNASLKFKFILIKEELPSAGAKINIIFPFTLHDRFSNNVILRELCLECIPHTE